LRAPLAAGPLRVHVDGAFVAQGSLPSVGAGGTLHLGLGVEEGLRVARHVTFVEHEKGLLSSSMALEHGVRIELRSNLPRAASVEVFERLPLAADQPEVDVSLDETSPVPVRDLGPEGHRLDGALKWTLSLPPNEATTLRYRYTVRIPAKKELIGGNRREP
jgi:hypothetical protein